MHFATLLMLTTALVLRSGDRIRVEGPITQRDGVIVFRSGGALYSMPVSEIDEIATNAADEPALPETTSQAPRPLKVSPAERMRLLKELEENHSGTAPVQQRMDTPAYIPLDAPGQNQDEWTWRRQARAYEEGLRQSKENLDLLIDRVERLRAEIRGLFALGFKPQNFTY